MNKWWARTRTVFVRQIIVVGNNNDSCSCTKCNSNDGITSVGQVVEQHLPVRSQVVCGI